MMKIEPAGGGAKNTDAEGKITKLTGDEAVSMNFWGFTPMLFPQLRAQFDAFLKKSGTEVKSECYIPITVNDLVVTRQAKVKVLRTNDSWFGVTYREDRPQVVESIRQLIAQGKYPEKLWA
jgi:flavin-dependent dehydrogenase